MALENETSAEIAKINLEFERNRWQSIIGKGAITEGIRPENMECFVAKRD